MLVRFCGMVWVLFRVFFLLNPFAPQYQETTIKVGFGTLRRGGGQAGAGRRGWGAGGEYIPYINIYSIKR